MRFMTVHEMKEIVNMCETLEDCRGGDLSFEPMKIVDMNGEVLGYVGIHDGDEYGFIFELDNAD